ncbi:hypothetical protein CTI12_AA497270 [Artemisia annua]|uniref:Uncharacterized protein n=1 Tax=Artemisia annua TaxID=35608 RepID=A0A2U1L052_ARTAN|nr:hypothetical protein CTI12_AA497270 [Artemisia annua]
MNRFTFDDPKVSALCFVAEHFAMNISSNAGLYNINWNSTFQIGSRVFFIVSCKLCQSFPLKLSSQYGGTFCYKHRIVPGALTIIWANIEYPTSEKSYVTELIRKNIHNKNIES